MANTIINSSIITKETLRILENELTFAKHANRKYDSQFASSGGKVGDTITIRKPNRWTVSDGEGLDTQNITEPSTTLTVDKRKQIAFSFSSQELTLEVDQFSERYLRTAGAALANKIDDDGLQLYKQVYNEVGTPGTVPSTLLTYLQAGQQLSEEATPQADRSMCISPEMQATIVNGLNALFHDTKEISRQYREGSMGMAAGFKFSMDQNVPVHTKGTHSTGSTPLTNGAGSEGNTTIVTDGWAASTAILKEGDTITVGSVNAVNPQNRRTLGRLRRFVVTDDVSSDGSGDATIPVSPTIRASGQYQTVDALPADGATITVNGTEDAADPVGLAHHKDFCTLACVDLHLPQGVDMASRIMSNRLGISLRFIRDYTISDDKLPCRFDILYGWKALYPELACRVAS